MNSKLLVGAIVLLVLIGLGWFLVGNEKEDEHDHDDHTHTEEEKEKFEAEEFNLERCDQVCVDGGKSHEVCDCQCDYLADNLETPDDLEAVLDGWFDPATFAVYEEVITNSINHSNTCAVE